MRRLVKLGFGFLALAIGITILIWCGYSFLAPNQHLHFRLIDLPRLLLPFAFIWFGWSWIRAEPAAPPRYAAELVVTLKLSGADYGTAIQRQRIFDMKHRLERALAQDGLAAIDGEEFGDGECSLFVQTNAPTKTANVIRQFLTSENSFSYTLTTAAP